MSSSHPQLYNTNNLNSTPAPNNTLSAALSRSIGPDATYSASSTLAHKRPASPDVEEPIRSRKRAKGEMDAVNNEQPAGEMPQAIDGHALAEDLAQELQCGCCSELVYKPVIVIPCDHFFCGSCCTLWVKNGGTNCPACRSVSTAVLPSRPLQAMVDVLIRAAPHRQRTERERMQADEIYPTLRAFRIPPPREPSPEPAIPDSSDFIQPCPHCVPNNSYRWTCPRPIPNPTTDLEHAWKASDGAPPGHGFCGNCEALLALRAPSSSRCDFCQGSFCGMAVPGRCVALAIAMQSPHGMMDVVDLIQSSEIYDCFEGNTVEVELMIDYITSQHLSPRQIYRQIAAHIQSQPLGFQPLIDQKLFTDMHGVFGSPEPELESSDSSTPHRLICRLCAAEIFLYGLRDWWAREWRKAVREGILEDRVDCAMGMGCGLIGDLAHAKEFNHINIATEQEKPTEAITSPPTPSPVITNPNSLTRNRDTSTPSLSLGSSLFLPPIGTPSGSSTILPSLPDFVSQLEPRESIPAFLSADDISLLVRTGYVPDNLRSDEDQPLETGHAIDYRGRDGELRNNDFEEEPSSSQSQRSVEALLSTSLLSEYNSDGESEAGNGDRDRNGLRDIRDARNAREILEACYVSQTGASSSGMGLPTRHEQEPSKTSTDVIMEDVFMEDAPPPHIDVGPSFNSISAFTAFRRAHSFSEHGHGHGYDSPGGTAGGGSHAHQSSSAYHLQVEQSTYF